jgi:uncharacterized protein YbaR (Trm112 family)
MAIAKELLDILVCPETHQPLELADDGFVARLNERISKGELKNRKGDKVTEPANGALIRKDRQFVYLIQDDIPIMLVDEAIPMTGLE